SKTLCSLLLHLGALIACSSSSNLCTHWFLRACFIGFDLSVSWRWRGTGRVCPCGCSRFSPAGGPCGRSLNWSMMLFLLEQPSDSETTSQNTRVNASAAGPLAAEHSKYFK
ncbi:unnamed protein product, partial [Musa acuminata var. zebrina]